MSQLAETAKDYFTSTNFKRDEVMDKLSEFLTVERGGRKLYEQALKCVRDPEVTGKFREFHEETIRHEQVLTSIVEKLGGDPTYMSKGAKLAQEKAHALLKSMTETLGMTPAQIEINAMENIVLAETKDHADWELLGHISHRAEDSKLANLLKPAVSEIEGQEDEHLNWTRQKMGQLALGSLATDGHR
jgi:rubrerythrin